MRLTGLLAVGVSLALAGCVDPGPIKRTDLNRYAEAMVLRSRQQDQGDRQPLNPIDADAVGRLDASTDPATKKTVVKLSLPDAVRRAVANNLDVRVTSFDPEISREEMVRAAAVFDMIVFSGVTYSVEDQRQNTVFDRTSLSKTHAFQVGVRKHTTTGADLTATYALTRLATSSAFVTRPTTYEPNFTLEMTQPLLRGAWQEVNLAALRVARINRRATEEAFRERVEAVVADTVSAYWALHVARRELAIQQNLLARTIKIHDKVELRRRIDATDVNVKQALASIAGRRALVIRAAKAVRDVEDALVQLMLGKQGAFAKPFEIVPITPAQTDLVRLDADGQLVTALKHSSQLARARLAVQAAGINVRVAENGLLPTLNLNASATWMGQDKRRSVGNDQVLDSRYFSYSVGLLFEYPLGNRDAQATRRRARYQRLQSVTNLQNIAVQIARTVSERVREVARAHEDLQAVRAAVLANKAHLDAIEAVEKHKGRLTPEFLLNLKLQALESLGASERDVEQAIVDYNTALVQLSQVTGTVLKQYGVVLADADEAPGDN